MRNVAEALDRAADRWGDRTYIRFGHQTVSFAQAQARALECAGRLASLGVRPGDRVAVIAPNRIEVVDLFLGGSLIGAVGVPLNVYLKGTFLAHQLSDCDPSLIVADQDGLDAVAQIGDHPVPTVGFEAGARQVWKDVAVRDVERPQMDESTLHSLLYTSGTTGPSKGCMLPHGYYLHSSTEASRLLGYGPDDVILTALPMYHGFARGALMSGLLVGAEIVIEETFSPRPFLERSVEVGATVLQLVGAMGHALLSLPDDAPISPRLRTATCIPFDPERSRRFQERFGATVLSQLYGQTECGGITAQPLGTPARPGTLGPPAPNFDVEVVDEHDCPVAEGEVGELIVRPRTPNSIYTGYWRRPQDTVVAWRNLWHHTGDLVRHDGDDLVFVDRKSDAIRRRGENVSSVEVEQVLLSLEGVAEVAVHAVASEETEDDIKACLVLDEAASMDPATFFDYCRQHLPYFAIPRYLEIVPSLPRTATMRVRKHVLRSVSHSERTWDLEALGYRVSRLERR